MRKIIALSACLVLGACLEDPTSPAPLPLPKSPLGHWQATKDTSFMGSPTQAIVDLQLTKDSALIQIQALGMPIAVLQGAWSHSADSIRILPSHCQSIALIAVNGQSQLQLKEANCASLEAYVPLISAWKLQGDSLLLSQKDPKGQDIQLSLGKK